MTKRPCLLLSQDTRTLCSQPGLPTSLMSNWDREGKGKWSQGLYCVFSVEPEHQARRRPGWQPQLRRLSLHPHPMGLPSMGPARACCSCDTPSQQTTLVYIQQKILSAGGRRFHWLIHFFLVHFLGIRHPGEFFPKYENDIHGFKDGEPLNMFTSPH